MRLFVAIDIDDDIRDRITQLVDSVRDFAPEARWVRPESLHITLKFIGEKSKEEAEEIKNALESIKADRFQMNVCGYGFFPGARAPRVFWIGVEADSKLVLLAATISQRLAVLNLPNEEHAFNPHLTLARDPSSTSRGNNKGANQNRGLGCLREKLAALSPPKFGTMTARGFFLYQSQTLSGGSRYTKLAGFTLQ